MSHGAWSLRLSAAALAVAGCGVATNDSQSGWGVPSPPAQSAPTGERWEGREVTDACGRSTLAWVLVDEICGGTTAGDYLSSLRTPMFRDGALVGSMLYTTDATHLWVLDAADPTRITRQQLVSGFGEPIAMQAQGQQLLLASGADGVVVADVSDPASPKRTTSLALPGPALDIHLSGSIACVAMGAAGLGVLDVSASQPKLLFTVPVPGFAAAVACRDGMAYVAACQTLAAVDLAQRKVVGQTWLGDAVQDDILVAPAKDVELAGGYAFVAAGRYGAVSVDVRDPANPVVRGNCTNVSDLSFYANGVRAWDNTLYVAAGEWGVLPLDVTDPSLTCIYPVQPELPSLLPSSDAECTSTPPWELQPWEDLWAPPPPSRDPIQVLPTADVVYAFGDARRLGVRAVDARDAKDPGGLLGRYDEPRNVLGVAARDGRVLVLGPGGGIFQRDDDALLIPAGSLPEDVQRESRFGAFLADGRVAVLAVDGNEKNRLWVEGSEALALDGTPPAQSLVADGLSLVIAGWQGPVVIDASGAALLAAEQPFGDTTHLPAVASAGPGETWFAAPEWPRTRVLAGGMLSDLEPHGVFDDDQILDGGRWLTAQPRRLLVPTQRGLVELASLGTDAAVAWHGGSLHTLPLPAATYVAGASAGDLVFLASVDRGLWRSDLLAIRLNDTGLELSSVLSFAGVAMGLAIDGDVLYVADADKGIHMFRWAQTPEALGTVPMEVTP